ncbi:MAG: hypothetical protein ACI82A_002532 [Candidatus Azotimanducaceae bacterium]|jgi:hypothetical protein
MKRDMTRPLALRRQIGLLGLLSILGCMGSSFVIAEPKSAIADDGREVMLKDNGEWEYLSEDKFATTPDGQRIRLKPNQRWQKVRDSEAPAYQPVPMTTVQRDNATIADSNVELILDQVHIENQREDVGKNTRLRSNLVFYLDIQGDLPGLMLQPEQFSVQDSRGKIYPVFSAIAGTAPIGSKPRWIIRAKGAPRWWGVKFFSLQVAPDVLGNTDSIELRKPMRDVLKKEVTDLPQDNL